MARTYLYYHTQHAVAGSARTGSSSKLDPRWEVALGRWAGAEGKSEKNSDRKVQPPAHAGAYDFELASSLGQLEIIGSGVRWWLNLAISSMSLRAHRCLGANILQDHEGLSLAISSLLT